MKGRKVIVWFRQDLRLHDNESLTEALRIAETVIPVYVFDERVFLGKTRWFGFPKTGRYRAQFIIEAVTALRKSLQALGSDLLVRVGKPEEILFDIAKENNTSWIFCNRERTQEEVDVQDALEKNLWTVGQELRYSRGKMLYYTADLPFPITHTPDTFTHFRKEVEKFIPIKEPLPSPDYLPGFPSNLKRGDIPTLADFGWDNFERDSRSAYPFEGGESNALDRLQYYLWESDNIKDYKETRNELLGTNYSSKLSAFLSQGCISPKTIYHEIKKYESERGKNDSTYWLIFELMWRDFFRLMGKKYTNKIFLSGGIKDTPDLELDNNRYLLEKWAEGNTGVPFVDANMREINSTGFMSNRGRQNVASFLVKDLKVNWQMGAEYFESLLIDYDPCSNWGNWNYVAGVGSDPRSDRYFNILSQAKRYDPDGCYIRTWLPELSNIPKTYIHQVDSIDAQTASECHFSLGRDYPSPLVNSSKWV